MSILGAVRRRKTAKRAGKRRYCVRFSYRDETPKEKARAKSARGKKSKPKSMAKAPTEVSPFRADMDQISPPAFGASMALRKQWVSRMIFKMKAGSLTPDQVSLVKQIILGWADLGDNREEVLDLWRKVKAAE